MAQKAAFGRPAHAAGRRRGSAQTAARGAAALGPIARRPAAARAGLAPPPVATTSFAACSFAPPTASRAPATRPSLRTRSRAMVAADGEPRASFVRNRQRRGSAGRLPLLAPSFPSSLFPIVSRSDLISGRCGSSECVSDHIYIYNIPDHENACFLRTSFSSLFHAQ